MRNILKYVVGLSCFTLFLTSCVSGSGSNGDGEDPRPTATVTATVTATPEPQPATEDASDAEPSPAAEDDEHLGEIGDAVKNHGVELTVNEAYSAKTIPMNNSNQSNDSPNAVFEDEPAPEGGKFIVVETTIDNVGSTSMDLTCGWPIEIVGVDVEEREFDEIDDLRKYQGNPRCNEKLQPGFSSEMTYVFAIPEDAEFFGMVFRDTNSADRTDYSAVLMDPPLK